MGQSGNEAVKSVELVIPCGLMPIRRACIHRLLHHRHATATDLHSRNNKHPFVCASDHRSMPALQAVLGLIPAGKAGLAIKVALSLLGVAWWTSAPGADEARWAVPPMSSQMITHAGTSWQSIDDAVKISQSTTSAPNSRPMHAMRLDNQFCCAAA